MTTLMEVYQQYLEFSEEEKAQFDALCNRGIRKPETDDPRVPTTDQPSNLYLMIKERVFQSQGVHLPLWSALKKQTAAEEELMRVWKWAIGGPNGKPFLDPQCTLGMLDLLSDVAANDIQWTLRRGGRLSMSQVVERLVLLPRAMEDAFPGYRATGALIHFAAKAGRGELPVVDLHPEREEE